MKKASIEVDVSRAILDSYYHDLRECLVSDVIIAGAGPAGLTAAYLLVKAGRTVTIIEKRLSPGGGIWGGGATMSRAVVQDSAIPILDEFGIRYKPAQGDLYTIDTIEMACTLCGSAIKAGTTMLNLHEIEDVCLKDGRVKGAVVNRSVLHEMFPIDPIVFQSEIVIDSTGHEAAVVQTLRKRGILKIKDGIRPDGSAFGEDPMDVEAGERFVAANAGEIFPGLYIAGMSVCTCYGGPRMGPIFGGMLLSGKRVAEMILGE
ncbi:MAG: thiazole biosynthesis protein [Candidatus Coatesbacteria bacterium]|nr:thiazole biosynthesis protein [Candidatus Coatesbacteria bacterium]